MLVLGSDNKLKALAERETAPVTDPDDMVKLADGWFDVQTKLANTAQKNVRSHAAQLYCDALPHLAGLSKTKLENRLEALNSIDKDPVPTFLTRLPEQEVRVWLPSIAKDNDQVYGDGRILVSSFSRRALSMHAPSDGSSHVTYFFLKHYSLFTAAASIADDRPSFTPLTFKVIGNGKELWSSQLQKNGKSVPCRINVTGISKLELEVDCNGFNGSAHAVWIDPLVR